MSKRRIVSVLAAATMSTGLMAGPAFAHQRGLVNVNVEENDIGIPVNVQVPIGIAANVCGVNAAVLAAAVSQDGDAECNAEAEAVAQNRAIQRFL